MDGVQKSRTVIGIRIHTLQCRRGLHGHLEEHRLWLVSCFVSVYAGKCLQISGESRLTITHPEPNRDSMAVFIDLSEEFPRD